MSDIRVDSFDDAVRQLTILNAKLDRSIRIASMRIVHDAVAKAKRYSSGPVKQKELRKRDHPFARRHPGPLLPPDIINEQTGDFKEDWKGTGPTKSASGFDLQVRNDNPVTEFFGGTRFMWERPIEDRLRNEIADDAASEVNDAITRLLGNG